MFATRQVHLTCYIRLKLQIHYKNLYNTQKQEIFIDKCNQGLTTYSCDFGGDLFEHYEGFKFYASPKEY